MSTFADNLIDALGGTTATARATGAPVSTVHSWRRIGIPPARLNHLKLIAEAAKLEIDWETGCKIEDEDNGDEPTQAAA